MTGLASSLVSCMTIRPCCHRLSSFSCALSSLQAQLHVLQLVLQMHMMTGQLQQPIWTSFSFLIILICAVAGEALDIIEAALDRRHIGSHKLNQRSSRSHLIIIFQHNSARTAAGSSTGATFSLVDLAGES